MSIWESKTVSLLFDATACVIFYVFFFIYEPQSNILLDIEKAPNATPPVMNCPSGDSTPLHTFTALPSSLITLMAPRRIPAVSAPNGNTNGGLSLFTSVGFHILSVSQYADYIQAIRPDITVALGDVPYGVLPGTKKVAKMGDRTSSWLDSFISDIEASSKVSASSPTAIFAPILPIDTRLQSYYLSHLSENLTDSISGLAFYDTSVLPNIPHTSAVSSLCRLSLDEPESPHHILSQVSLGIDLFAIPFIGFATDAGVALTFRFLHPLSHQATGAGEIQPLGVDLFAPENAMSLAPLADDCVCYTCKIHHRAYIQHLLSAKEMLGWVLLQVHNHHVISQFFSAIRESIRGGRFETDRLEFGKAYESELPEGTSQKPRARGYNFRSTGPGETKRNKPAWGALGDGNGEVNGAGGEDSALIPDKSATELENKGFAETA